MANRKRKIFLDTNIILDVLLERPNFYESSAKLFEFSSKSLIDLFASSISIVNISYILRKDFSSQKKVSEYLQDLMELVRILPVTEATIKLSLGNGFSDFEDGVQYTCALENKMDCIITRNKRDFKASKITVFDSQEFLSTFKP